MSTVDRLMALVGRLEIHAFNAGYEDASPADAWTRQEKANKARIEARAALRAELERLFAQEPVADAQACPLCNGSGEVMKVSFSDPSKMIPNWCSVCKGTGRLPAQPAADAKLNYPQSHVATVPDHCDRIVWRGRYYHLPLKDAPPATDAKDAERYRWLRTQHQGHEDLQFDSDGLPMPMEPIALAWTVFRPKNGELEPVGCIPGELDAAIDAQIAATPNLLAALRDALATYRPTWVHPGTDRNPTQLPEPEWVKAARAALAAAKEATQAKTLLESHLNYTSQVLGHASPAAAKEPK